MAVWTMGFVGIVMFAAMTIDDGRDRLKMIRIAAKLYFAKMVNFKSGTDLSNKSFVYVSMRSIKMRCFSTLGSGPNPASGCWINDDLLLQPFREKVEIHPAFLT